MRIVFFGTAAFGIPSLEKLAGHHDIAAVVTREPARKGRGRTVQETPVAVSARMLGLTVIEQERLRDEHFLQTMRDLKADLYFVVAFKIMPRELYTIPLLGTVNLHASLLPDYRGAAPINHAIINGESETGLTTFFIDEQVDTGDMIKTLPIAIDPDETAGELTERMAAAGADMTLETINMIESGTAARKKQPAGAGKPAPKLHKGDGLIDWSRDATTIHNQVRGMNPVPGAFIEWSRGPLKIHRTRIVSDTAVDAAPGTITQADPRDGITVSCGRGTLSLLTVQPPGKKAISAADFVRGYRLSPGLKIAEETR